MGSNFDPNSLLDQILSEYGKPDNLRFRSLEAVNKLVQRFANDGKGNLQVITDFDFTLSKHHTSEKKCSPAADIIRQSPLMSDEFKARARERYDKLLPIELDTSLTIEQKTPAVITSFQEGFTDLVTTKVLNRTTLTQMIAEAEKTCNFQLRDRCHTALQCLHEAQVPVLIFSAGFGDIVQGLLYEYKLYYPNIHVIANFMEFDDNEQLVGFKDPLIHTFNKNESVIPENCQYFEELSHRSNVILLGDMIGDAGMAEGVHKQGAVLKIGFLNEVDDQQLSIFMDIFDVVIMDDQSMDFVNCLLKSICSKT